MLDSCAPHLLAVDGPAIDKLVAARPYFTKGRIPGAQYGLSTDVASFGVVAILMTTASMDSRVVAEFANSLTTQIDTLKKNTRCSRSVGRRFVSVRYFLTSGQAESASDP
jgi:uncharacterized protein